ncbi:MAG: hypothetical protein O3A55_00930 [Bacteroidetes bacterium]|nr:hypothetical protein [Bacteroidota bacterium]
MNSKTILYKLIIAFTFLFLFNSCEVIEPVTTPDESFRGEVVSTSLLKEYTPEEIKAIGFPFLISFNIKIYKIIFKTIDGSGKEIQASGAVLIPQKDDSLATVFYSHGSVFKKTDGAASELGSSINEALLFAGTGYVIFFPDYLGFGASKEMLHPYIIQKYYASSGVDFYRAAKKFSSDNKIKLNGKNFLMGYSEGAYSTLSLQKEIEKNYSNEFKITAVSAGAGPYSMTETSKYLIGSTTLSYPAYIAYVFMSYKKFYNLSYPYPQIFNEPFASRLDSLFNGELSGPDINRALTYKTDSLLTKNFITSYLGDGYTDIKSYFTENDLIDWKPVAPLRLFHGEKDITVPYLNSVKAFESFKSKGANVSFVVPTVGARDHTGSAIYWFYDTASWLATF